MKKTIFCVSLFVLICGMFTGCSSITQAIGQSSANKDFKDNEDGLTTENSVIFFGSGAYSATVIQQNPEIGKRIYGSHGISKSTLLGYKEFFVCEPIPVGAELHVYSTTYAYGNGTMTQYSGIGGIDNIAEAPGLIYWDYYDKDHKTEKAALEYIAGCYKDTDWEPIIQARIEELSK